MVLRLHKHNIGYTAEITDASFRRECTITEK